jgi:hypothetical protein
MPQIGAFAGTILVAFDKIPKLGIVEMRYEFPKRNITCESGTAYRFE